LHKKQYRGTGLGQEQRKRENEKQRQKPTWARDQRERRRANPATKAQERERAGRYYAKHRDEILRRRRERRADRDPDA
jgi:hypothetical protein